MGPIAVNGNRDGFVVGGRPWFYFADTVWSAFSRATLEEWTDYLDYRQAQGFNVLQISILPILHDASGPDQGAIPFASNSSGAWDFGTPDIRYFAKAQTMVRMASEAGFVVTLVVLWANYVQETAFAVRDPSHVMPLAAVEPYTRMVMEAFAAYNPVYCISGDTDFGSHMTTAYYMTALNTIKSIDPTAITTLHLQPSVRLPDEIARSSLLDFCMYQAGHRLEDHRFNYLLAEDLFKHSKRRPIVNGEPAYEGHGYGNTYGRFDAFWVRKAFWQSVLSGAKAGFAYGAHGVWSWHRKGNAFTNVEWSKTPFDWKTALRFPGAWDAAFSRWLFEVNGLFGIDPRNDLLRTEYPDIRAAATGDLSAIVVYAPYSVDIPLDADLRDYECRTIVLSERNVTIPRLRRAGGATVVEMVESNSDSLVICKRK